MAKKAAQLAPDNPVVRQLLSQSRMIRRLDTQKSIAGDKENGFIEAMVDVDRSGTPFVGPIEFPATKAWEDLTKNRNRLEGRAAVVRLAGRGRDPQETLRPGRRRPSRRAFGRRPRFARQAG